MKMKWNLNRFKKEILKLKTNKRSEIAKKVPYFYVWSKNNGKEKEINDFLNKICMSSFEARSLAKTKYTKEHILNEFKKFSTRQELFKSKNGMALISAANRFGIYKECSKHFKKPSAGTSTGEETVRLFLEEVFNEKFIKIRHPKIINPKTGYPLELDGFCKKLNLAFEYGDHSKARSESVEYLKFKDNIKIKRCRELGIKLIQINDIFLNYDEYEKKLKTILYKEFKKLKIIVPKNFSNKKVKISCNKPIFSKTEIWTAVKNHQNITGFKGKNREMVYSAKKLNLLGKIKDYYHNKQRLQKKTPGYWRELENIIKASKKCKTRTEFNNKYKVAQREAKKLGIYEEICKHMKKGHHSYYWTPEKILSLAEKYYNLTNFCNSHSGATEAAKRFKIFHKVKIIINNNSNKKAVM